ncbi:pilus assembly protein TadG-related protein [Corynebacterium kroppenstedtii]|uniref:pilus assembly protein TadG-related protein n=1 Tax=Corynebacterium sp. PCR 32 TaxID=3351342 RepID=UPI0030AE7868
MTIVGAVMCTLVIGVFGALVVMGSMVVDSRKADRAADLSALAAAYAVQNTMGGGDQGADSGTQPRGAGAHTSPQSSADIASGTASSDGCVIAREVAMKNDASLTSCIVDGEDVVVTVNVSAAHSPFVAAGTARAGPA